jgi:hypothetical protein
MLKLLALLAGAAGVVGFFLPLAEYRDTSGKIQRTASAYEIATTETDPDSIAEFAKGLGASQEQADQIAETAEQTLLAYRGTIVAFYIPAALQALFALVNLLRSRMGRIAGFLAILLGAANGAVFAYFYVGAARNADPNASLGYGVWLLAAAGAGGILAGLLTMFAPDND